MDSKDNAIVLGAAKRSSFRDFKEEFKKISWTAPGELKLCTKIVIGVTFVFGLGIYAADLLVRGVLQGVESLLFLIIR